MNRNEQSRFDLRYMDTCSLVYGYDHSYEVLLRENEHPNSCVQQCHYSSSLCSDQEVIDRKVLNDRSSNGRIRYGHAE